MSRTVTCEICGTTTDNFCTNGRCMPCHQQWCTPGGTSSPGHGRRWPDEERARQEASESFHDDPRNPSSCASYEEHQRAMGRKDVRCPCEASWRDHVQPTEATS